MSYNKLSIMKVFVRVKSGARLEKIEQIDQYHFFVWTKEPAKEEKANKSATKILAKFLGVSPSRVVLKKGRHFQEKTFEIE